MGDDETETAFLKAPYTDPKSRLRYHSAEIYELVRSFVSLH